MDAREYSSKIIDLEKGRDYRAAYEVVQEALTVYPTNPFFLRTEVYILYRLKMMREAREKAEGRMGLLKNDPFFLKTYLSLLESQKAKEDMERLLEQIPSWGIRNEDFYSFLARLVSKNFGPERALETLKAAIANLPESRSLKDLYDRWCTDGNLEGRFKHYRERFKGRKTEEAIVEIESIRVLPDYAGDYELHLYLAELYKKAQRYNEASEVYLHLLKLKDHPFTRKMLGYVYYKAGEMEKALAYLKDVFLSDPNDHYLYSTIMKIYGSRPDYEGFERLVQQALGLKPDAKHLYGLLRRAKKWRKD